MSQHVRDKVVAPVVAPTTEGNLAQTVVVNAREVPDKVVFSTRSGSGWQDVTATQFADEVNRLAKGLIAAGVEAGDRVGLMSRTRYEWTLIDYAIWTAGAVTVPIYETSSAEQVAWILDDSGAVAVVVETATHAGAVSAVRDRPARPARRLADRAGALDELNRAGADVGDETSTRAGPAPTAPRSRRSSTPPARPDAPRAASSPTATSWTSRRTPASRSPPSCGRTARRRCCSCRSPTCSPGSSRSSASRPRPGWATRATSSTLLDDFAVVPADVHPRRAPRLREDLQLRRAEGRGRRQGHASSPRAAATAIAWSEALDTGGPGVGLQAQARASSTGSSTASCGPPWAAGSSTRCPAARRSGRGSATSTGASASSSSRATA